MGPEQLGRLIDQHAAALVLYARQWCAAPEDVVQEALVKLVRQRKPPEGERLTIDSLFPGCRDMLADPKACGARRRS
ncbi:MAG TPA: hypothetical protein VFA26_00740 [Gemmataceae bacterium]|nr:hypothetical protein [Gemmataceae bacterium]